MFTVIFDIGQFTTKVGFAGENEPRSVFYSVTGVPKYQNIGTEQAKQIYVGNEVTESLGLYKVTYPIEKGEIVDWPSFEAIIDYAFYALRIDTSSCNLLYVTNPFLSIESRKRLASIFLEKYQVMGYYTVLSPILTMYSGGFGTGLVVDMGASNIRIVPIIENFMLKHAARYIPLGGAVLTDYMKKLLNQAGFQAEFSVQKELIRILKERACFASLNYEDDVKNAEKYRHEYSFPDGTEISIGAERFMVPELLYHPDLMEIESPSLSESIVDCDLWIVILISVPNC